jgi:hypothetical protein
MKSVQAIGLKKMMNIRGAILFYGDMSGQLQKEIQR